MRSEQQIAESLCKKAEKLGLCHPTEDMISECIGEVKNEVYEDVVMMLYQRGYNIAADFIEKVITSIGERG